MQNCATELLHDEFVEKRRFPQQNTDSVDAKVCLSAPLKSTKDVTLLFENHELRDLVPQGADEMKPQQKRGITP
jgi:hypothetical protein